LGCLGIERAHFVGNSMGGTLLLQVVAKVPCPWPIDKAVIVSGGGNIPENAARETLNSYDGTLDHMRRIVETMFVNPAVRTDAAYIERRHLLSLEAGAWESRPPRVSGPRGARPAPACPSRRTIYPYRGRCSSSPGSKTVCANQGSAQSCRPKYPARRFM
jgi:pimeloyl-ACP methyl ester carboxylesterase